MADTFRNIRMQTGDVSSLASALLKLDIRELAADYGLRGDEMQSLYELRDAVAEVVPSP